MTFTEARLSLQYEAEERVGGPMREMARQARAEEDALAARASAEAEFDETMTRIRAIGDETEATIARMKG